MRLVAVLFGATARAFCKINSRVLGGMVLVKVLFWGAGVLLSGVYAGEICFQTPDSEICCLKMGPSKLDSKVSGILSKKDTSI